MRLRRIVALAKPGGSCFSCEGVNPWEQPLSQGTTNRKSKPSPVRRSGRPTQRETVRKSEQLIGIATDFFVEHGFSGTTIEAIAAAANMGKQAVYTRYSDKEALFDAVIRRLKDQAVFQELPSNDGHRVAEGLPQRIRAIFHDASNPDSMVITKLAMRQGHRFPELAHLLVEGTLERYTRPLAAYLEARKRAGELRDIDSLEAASMCIDLIFAEVSRYTYTDRVLPVSQIELCAERISALLLRGMAAD